MAMPATASSSCPKPSLPPSPPPARRRSGGSWRTRACRGVTRRHGPSSSRWPSSSRRGMGRCVSGIGGGCSTCVGGGSRSSIPSSSHSPSTSGSSSPNPSNASTAMDRRVHPPAETGGGPALWWRGDLGAVRLRMVRVCVRVCVSARVRIQRTHSFLTRRAQTRKIRWMVTFPGHHSPDAWGIDGHWHIDGINRRRCIHTQEVSVVPVLLFSDVEPLGGGTALCRGSHHVRTYVGGKGRKGCVTTPTTTTTTTFHSCIGLT